ncbi:hypothetical protein Sta7437_0672 [Stanieria cyanosphaera PCC 7437]|uniref:Uncharacterized protein n=1 Tax=Stanieria cyanosphaera (strain ATCC 29371 / PCC 7437) TaxID=111780 RepID=K9XRF6_STAC7|nr:hypothetical protein [Stanieria cyanosphaera]AFZ34267.1 hypothetical protein Sta7437_0672 [Stanieria cyanosphaera PCC 7437]
MRYSIMLQIVGIITFTLVSTAALFAWLQNRDISQPETLGSFHSKEKLQGEVSSDQ